MQRPPEKGRLCQTIYLCVYSLCIAYSMFMEPAILYIVYNYSCIYSCSAGFKLECNISTVLVYLQEIANCIS